MLQGSLESLRNGEKFDLVILSHVLEHVVNPVAFLKKIRSHLADEGLLYIEVPSLEGVLDGKYYYDLARYFQNAHVSHFSSDSLENVMGIAGFKGLQIDSQIRSVWQLDPAGPRDYVPKYLATVKLLEEIEAKRRSPVATIKSYYKKVRRGIFLLKMKVSK